jgi:hypothetical protein
MSLGMDRGLPLGLQTVSEMSLNLYCWLCARAVFVPLFLGAFDQDAPKFVE